MLSGWQSRMCENLGLAPNDRENGQEVVHRNSATTHLDYGSHHISEHTFQKEHGSSNPGMSEPSILCVSGD